MSEPLKASKTLLSGQLRHPSLTLTTRYLDAHVYVFRRTFLDLLSTRRPRDLDSIKEQIVPWLIKGGWQRKLQERWDPSETLYLSSSMSCFLRPIQS